MSATRNFVVAVVAVAVIGGLAYRLMTREGKVPAPVAGVASPSDESIVASVPSSASPLHNGPLPAMASPPLAEFQAASRIQMNADVTRLENTWASDLPDPENGTKTEDGLIEKSLSPRVHEVREQPISLADVACRSTMCRIESDFPAGSAGTEWGTRMLMEMGATFGASSMYSQPGKDGTTRLTIYAFRLGKGAK